MKRDEVLGAIGRQFRLKEIFEDTLKQIEKNSKLRKATREAEEKAKFYGESDGIDVQYGQKHAEKINAYTTGERTFEAAKRLMSEGDEKVAVLNFANSVRPGGGVKGGSSAQEEQLCRCSNLFPIIDQIRFHDLYYLVNTEKRSPLGSDAIIYAPDVTVFKSDADYPEMLPEKDWFKADVITCAAPNLYFRGDKMSDEEQYKVMFARAGRILDSAIVNNARRLVLGAFGCGAFHNDPKIVAKAFYDASMENGRFREFEEVVFAVYHREDETENFGEFAKVFPVKPVSHQM